MREASYCMLEKSVQMTMPRLFYAWRVKCSDYTYTSDVSEMQIHHNLYAIIRGIQGRGKIITNNHILQVNEADLIIVKYQDIIKYMTVSDIWEYNWYNVFFEQLPPFFELEKTYSVPFESEERNTIDRIFMLMYDYNDISCKLAISLFASQFYTWIDKISKMSHANTPYNKELQQAVHYVNSHLSEAINFDALALSYNISPRYFRTLFTKFTGKAPKTYQLYMKLHNAAAQLKTSSLTVQEIADSLGYYSQFQFSRDFKKLFGVSPVGYRKA